MLNPLSIINNLFKSNNQKELDRLKKLVISINNKEKDIKSIAPESFKTKTLEMREKIKKGHKLDDFLPEAFALVREAAYRSLGERHFDVQLMWGIT